MRDLQIRSNSRTDFINITSQLEDLIREEEVLGGIMHLFVPHTTAGITINEGADPAVMHDLGHILNHFIPWQGSYKHQEGNSAAHVKSSLMGSSLQLMINRGRLVLGTWQAIFFCEFDGPRLRKILVKIM